MTSRKKPKQWKAWGVFRLNLQLEIDEPPDFIGPTQLAAGLRATIYSFPVAIKPILITLAPTKRKRK